MLAFNIAMISRRRSSVLRGETDRRHTSAKLLATTKRAADGPHTVRWLGATAHQAYRRVELRAVIKLFLKIVGWIVGAIFLLYVRAEADNTTKYFVDGALIIWLFVVPAWKEFTRRRYAHMERMEEEIRALRRTAEEHLRRVDERAKWGAKNPHGWDS
jgi:hypothetical protein